MAQDIAGLALDRMGEIRKKMGFLFQHAALYDSLTVAENVAFPLEHHRREMSKSERADRVKQLLAEVGSGRRSREDAVGYLRRHAKARGPGACAGAGAGDSVCSTSPRPVSTPSAQEKSTS